MRKTCNLRLETAQLRSAVKLLELKDRPVVAVCARSPPDALQLLVLRIHRPEPRSLLPTSTDALLDRLAELVAVAWSVCDLWTAARMAATAAVSSLSLLDHRDLQARPRGARLWS